MSMDATQAALRRIERDTTQIRINQIAIMSSLAILLPAATQSWLEEQADAEIERLKDLFGHGSDDAEEAPDAA